MSAAMTIEQIHALCADLVRLSAPGVTPRDEGERRLAELAEKLRHRTAELDAADRAAKNARRRELRRASKAEADAARATVAAFPPPSRDEWTDAKLWALALLITDRARAAATPAARNVIHFPKERCRRPRPPAFRPQEPNR